MEAGVMKKTKPNILLITGWILFAIARIAVYTAGEHINLLHALNGFAIGLIITGAVLQVLIHHKVIRKF